MVKKTKNIGWTCLSMSEIGDKATIGHWVHVLAPFLDLAQFSDVVERILIIPIIFPNDMKNKFPEKRFYSVRKKTLTIAKHFDYDTFLDSSKEACEKILLAGFLEEFKHIKQMRGMKKVNFDVDAFCGKVKALTEKMECQKMP